MNYPTIAEAIGKASVLKGECLSLDLRPRVGLTSPPTAGTAAPVDIFDHFVVIC